MQAQAKLVPRCCACMGLAGRLAHASRSNRQRFMHSLAGRLMEEQAGSAGQLLPASGPSRAKGQGPLPCDHPGPTAFRSMLSSVGLPSEKLQGQGMHGHVCHRPLPHFFQLDAHRIVATPAWSAGSSGNPFLAGGELAAHQLVQSQLQAAHTLGEGLLPSWRPAGLLRAPSLQVQGGLPHAWKIPGHVRFEGSGSSRREERWRARRGGGRAGTWPCTIQLTLPSRRCPFTTKGLTFE